MFCLYCGAKIPEDALFCNHCGKAQSDVKDTRAKEGAVQSTQLPAENISTAPDTSQASEVSVEHETPFVVTHTLFWPDTSHNNVPSISSVSTLPPYLGYYITGGAGILALLAFFFMPYIAVGIFTATGQQLASDGNQFSQFQILWLEPLVAALVIGITVYEVFRNKQNDVNALVAQRGAIGLISLAVLTLVALIIKYTIDAQPPAGQTAYNVSTIASFYSSGFWMYIVAMIGVIIGGIVQIKLT